MTTKIVLNKISRAAHPPPPPPPLSWPDLKREKKQEGKEKKKMKRSEEEEKKGKSFNLFFDGFEKNLGLGYDIVICLLY